MIEVKRLKNPDTGKAAYFMRTLKFRVGKEGEVLVGMKPKWGKWREIEIRNLTNGQVRRLVLRGDMDPPDWWDWSLGPRRGWFGLRTRKVTTIGIESVGPARGWYGLRTRRVGYDPAPGEIGPSRGWYGLRTRRTWVT